jgi:protein TonB
MQLNGRQTDPLGLTLVVAAAIHAFVILGITFEPFGLGRPEHRQQSLDIIVVNQAAKPPKEDEKPDFLAQTSQAGSGELQERVKPSVESAPPPLPPPQPQPQQVQPQQQTPLTTTESEQQSPPESLVETPPVPLNANQLLLSRDMEVARLTADVQRRSQAIAKIPKRKTINASTKEYKYTAYLDSWRRKVESIGNLNYPDQAKRDRLYGNLVLHVAVRADGSIEQVRVRHSSGHKILDDAAVRIVRMSAPFSPFPEDIRKETDILDITRTWVFLRSGRFGSK